jgi:hypothetical protein
MALTLCARARTVIAADYGIAPSEPAHPSGRVVEGRLA